MKALVRFDMGWAPGCRLSRGSMLSVGREQEGGRGAALRQGHGVWEGVREGSQEGALWLIYSTPETAPPLAAHSPGDRPLLARRAMTYAYYWYNFMPLARGTAAVGYTTLMAWFWAAGMPVTATIPKDYQVGWVCPDRDAAWGRQRAGAMASWSRCVGGRTAAGHKEKDETCMGALFVGSAWRSTPIPCTHMSKILSRDEQLPSCSTGGVLCSRAVLAQRSGTTSVRILLARLPPCATWHPCHADTPFATHPHRWTGRPSWRSTPTSSSPPSAPGCTPRPRGGRPSSSSSSSSRAREPSRGRGLVQGQGRRRWRRVRERRVRRLAAAAARPCSLRWTRCRVCRRCWAPSGSASSRSTGRAPRDTCSAEDGGADVHCMGACAWSGGRRTEDAARSGLRGREVIMSLGLVSCSVWG